MYVPPNTIDFNTVFTAEKFLESMPVFCTVAGMIAIYLLVILRANLFHFRDAPVAQFPKRISVRFRLSMDRDWEQRFRVTYFVKGGTSKH